MVEKPDIPNQLFPWLLYQNTKPPRKIPQTSKYSQYLPLVRQKSVLLGTSAPKPPSHRSQPPNRLAPITGVKITIKPQWNRHLVHGDPSIIVPRAAIPESTRANNIGWTDSGRLTCLSISEKRRTWLTPGVHGPTWVHTCGRASHIHVCTYTPRCVNNAWERESHGEILVSTHRLSFARELAM